MDIDIAIRGFSDFLNLCWRRVLPLLEDRTYTTNEGSINDWLQANWELLVERKVLPLNEYLEIYGEGSDYYGESSRITDVQSMPCYSIRVISCCSDLVDLLNKAEIGNVNLIFDRLVGFENGFYIDNPPFNYVLVQDESSGNEMVLPLEKIRFELQTI